MRRVITLVALLCTGCATLTDFSQSPELFAACRAADAASTLVNIHHGYVETGTTLIAPTASWFGVSGLPFVVFQGAIIVAVWHIWPKKKERDGSLAVLNAINCYPATQNIFFKE